MTSMSPDAEKQKTAIERQKTAIEIQEAAIETQKTAIKTQEAAIATQKIAIETQEAAIGTQKTAIDTDGFIFLADSAVGARAEEFAKKGWPRRNIDGLRYLKQHTVDDQRIVNLLRTTLPRSKVGAYMLLDPVPNRIFCFLAPQGKERQTLAILIGGRGLRMVLYKGSHKLVVQPAIGSLMQLVPEQLAVDSVSPVTVELKEGGYIIFDGRLGFTILEGVAVALVSATPECLKPWKTLELQNLPELKEFVAESSHSTVGFNFTFES